MPKISIIMPCYNAAATIQETIPTISNQAFDDFEILAIDDGSTDKTLNLLRDWAGKDARVKVIELPHQGIIPTLNEGIRVSKGEYIARMDADDLMDVNRLHLQSEFLDKNVEIGVVASLVDGFPPDSVREGFQIYMDWLNSLISHDQIVREIFIESPVCHPSVMVRKKVMHSVGGYQDNGWAEDYDLWLRMYLAGIKFGKVPQTLLSWREHPKRLTRVDARYSVENFIRAKAHYLMKGPLKNREAIFIWGAGMNGKRISKYLVWENMPIVAFVDVDDKKIGNTRRGYPIVSVQQFQEMWREYNRPILLSAVAARGARKLIRAGLTEMGLVEGQDWLGVA